MNNIVKSPSIIDQRPVSDTFQETSELCFDLGTITPEQIGKLSHKVFIRLFGDMVAELNRAVDLRVEQVNCTRGQLAISGGQDPAFFSRVLSGQSGTNLRSIATVLAITNHRMRVSAVPCEELSREKRERDSLSADKSVIILVVQKHAGIWQLPVSGPQQQTIERQFVSPVQSNLQLKKKEHGLDA